MSIEFELLHPMMTQEHLGVVPFFFDVDDERRAKDQLDTNYAHGGGYKPFGEGLWIFDRETLNLKYPGDPYLQPLAKAYLRDELLVFYEHALLAIVQRDGSFVVTRVD